MKPIASSARPVCAHNGRHAHAVWHGYAGSRKHGGAPGGNLLYEKNKNHSGRVGKLSLIRPTEEARQEEN